MNNRRPRTTDSQTGTIVGTAKFDVGAVCITHFTGRLAVTVSDTNNGSHTGSRFNATVAPVSATGCSPSQQLTVTLNQARSGSQTAQLVDQPLDQSLGRCSYVVSYTDAQVASQGTANVQLERQGDGSYTITAPTSQNTAANTAAVEYDAVRAATITLRNATPPRSSHSGDRSQVQVTLTPSACGSDTVPQTITRTLAASASQEVSLGTASCTWTVAFQNPQADCAISAELENASSQAIAGSQAAAPGGAGSLVLHVNNRRPRTTNSASGTIVSAAKFDVGAVCVTHFTGRLSVTVSDTSNGSHTGSVFNATVAPVSATGCSPSQQLTVTLAQPRSGSQTAQLVDQPLDQSLGRCSYAVSYTDAQVASQGTAGVQLERQGDGRYTITAPTSQNNTANTAAVTYDAVRAATIRLVNATTEAHSSDTTRREVLVSLTSSGCEGSGTPGANRSPRLAAEADLSVALGTQDCTWTITWRNPSADCQVTAQPQRLAGDSGGPLATDNDGTLQIHVVDRRARLTDAANGIQLSAINFAVTAVCDTVFDGSVSVTVSDTLAAGVSTRNHAGTAIAVRVSSSGGAGCSAAQSRTAILNSAGQDTVRFAGLAGTPAGGSPCVYQVSFPSQVNSLTNPQVRLVNANTGSVTLGGSAPAAALAYRAEAIPVTVPQPPRAVSVSAAAPVTEGQPLQFTASLPGPAAQQVQVSYTVDGHSPVSSAAATGSITIQAGQTAAVIEIPTDDDQLDEPDQTVQITLTAASGGTAIDQFGRSAHRSGARQRPGAHRGHRRRADRRQPAAPDSQAVSQIRT